MCVVNYMWTYQFGLKIKHNAIYSIPVENITTIEQAGVRMQQQLVQQLNINVLKPSGDHVGKFAVIPTSTVR